MKTGLNASAQSCRIVGDDALSVLDVVDIAACRSTVALSDDARFTRRINAGAEFLERLLADGGTVYGVTTGYGESCTVVVPADLVAELPLHLTRYHGCGLGEHLPPEAVRAVLVARLVSLARGASGVRHVLLQRLVDLLNHDLLPCIPAEGSVGASGDLTPLSYLAATLIGERAALYRGKLTTATEAWEDLGIAPLKLAPKEGLAIMNGTSVMTGLACLAVARAEYLTRLCCRITALASQAIRGNAEHFDPRLFAVKPHAGQMEAARWIWEDLGGTSATSNAEGVRLQDRYSIRCAPHVIGVARDALSWIRRDVENELNSANDNPIIDGEAGWVLHGGHFYGGHVAFAMDALKTAVANLADLMDRQLALLVDNRYNHGLPQNLSGTVGPRAAINHGFKAVQIGTSAWTAEALKLTMPASVFSRSTECHNQDKVSLGTIAARDCLRILELTEQVFAALVLATVQAVELRFRGETPVLTAACAAFVEAVRVHSEFLDEDRPLDGDLLCTVELIRSQYWSLYA
ncbi:aromatic amino acid ammonia-lyase [Accumulibacter sp.]|uniref:HAL/PAL/TAL family ammonia-lyase n=1 Tax=Accumulibacter sp. TaxID=2053492 RepID=UPI0025F6C681|nr:aromatic amino acid ammonia-lyase [Accumulibacter sp.]MCM8614098.1 aromatic amino acid ammonia-lyase [Accumulibacter sp.]MCM8637878.1 aromatic amino acid ammonia-lyase [Accumulibacter sp.]MCM8641285.1 aromatic amino acid ammonia-lyase [Accumulibacter sp.]